MVETAGKMAQDEAEDAAAEARRAHELIEVVPAFVLAFDAAGRITFWNQRLERATGRSRDDMVGQSGQALVGQGGIRPLSVVGAPERLVRWTVANDGGGQTLAVGIDVTAEQEALRQTLRAERAAAAVTLAEGLAHELRNPLNAAALQLQVLRRRLLKLEGGAELGDTVLASVDEEIRRLERLVADFIAVAQPRPLSLEPRALAALCQEVLRGFAAEAAAANVTVELVTPSVGPVLEVDPARLTQVLQNLVRNAIEAMTLTQGGRLRLELRPSSDARAVEIDVADTGPGFHDEMPIFDAFYTTKPKGTGLGLSIVHRIVNDHGGSVRVRSQPGATCFTLTLPTRAVPPAP